MKNNFLEKAGLMAVGVYAWIVTVFFGAVLLDVIYSTLLGAPTADPVISEVFSGVSDFLLRIGFITVLAALSAIGFSWKSKDARMFFIASLAVLFIEFLAPSFLSEETLNSGYWIRLSINGTASVLAMFGLFRFYHNK